MKPLLLALFICVSALGQPQEQTKSDKETYVLICASKNAYAYHKHECKGLKKCSHEVKKITLKEAKEKGYKACGYCYKK
ncbi:MAG: hypothetical protein LBJ63_00410 [Prevotellaceae bacterium]|jgi:hypothetical protein|nr:hypothetical protein [Prevotellaceae bacterium]